jgi:hypothetical protein
MKTIVILLLLAAAASAFAFPLRHMEMDSVVDLSRFTYQPAYVPDNDTSKVKVLFLWRSDKRLSKKQYGAFSEYCGGAEVTCLAVDKLGAEHIDEGVISAYDAKGYTDSWGAVALPLTILLSKDNRIIDAVGYEGQYVDKLTSMINSLISK